MSLLPRPHSATREPPRQPALKATEGRAAAPARRRAAAMGSHVASPEVIRRRLIGLMVASSLGILLILAVPLLTGHVPARWDLGSFHIPVRDFYARCLAARESFDWAPAWFCGYFVSGEGQLGGYHPLHMLLYRCLPLDTAFAAEVYVHCPLLLIGMCLFLRRHAGTVGALMGAMLFTFSLRYSSHLQHPNLAGVLAHIPWLLWAMDVAVTSAGPKRTLASAGIGFLTASQILLGHPQAFWFSLLTVAAYAAYLLLHKRPRAAAWIAITGGKVLGLLMGAVQLLASYSAFAVSTRADANLDYALAFPFHPKGLVGMVAPCLGWGYFGAVPLILLLWWATARRTQSAPAQFSRAADQWAGGMDSRDGFGRASDRLALGALLFAVATLLLSFGRYGGLYYLQTHLPVVGKFRAPARYLTLTQFGVAVASAVAFSRLVAFVNRGRRIPWCHLALPWMAVVAAVVMAVCRPTITPAIATESTWNGRLCYCGPVLLLAAASALTLAARGRQLGLFALVAVAVADLGLVALICGDAKHLWYKTPVLDEWVASFGGPPGPCQGRIYEEGFYGNNLALHGHLMASGYAGLSPKKLLDYRDATALRLAGVAWYRANPFQSRAKKARGLGPPVWGRWHRVPEPLPRARLVNQIKVSSSPGEDLGEIDIETTALVGRPLRLSSGPPGTAAITRDRPGNIDLHVGAPGRQLLVVSESYHPGWNVLVDGHAAELLRVNGDFMGCVVERGSHHVELAFRPAALIYGTWLSLAGLATSLCLCAVAARQLPPTAARSRDAPDTSLRAKAA